MVALPNPILLAPSSAAAVANEFLNLGDQERGTPIIDQMKLQKCVFYAHGWHLGFGKGPLFEADVQAWPWGPVIRDIYEQTADCGRGPVRARIWEYARSGNIFDVVTPDGVGPDLKSFIHSVWDSVKRFSGIQLSNSTHAAGEPWTIIAEKLGTRSKPTIPNDLIEEVFRRKLAA